VLERALGLGRGCLIAQATLRQHGDTCLNPSGPSCLKPGWAAALATADRRGGQSRQGLWIMPALFSIKPLERLGCCSRAASGLLGVRAGFSAPLLRAEAWPEELRSGIQRLGWSGWCCLVGAELGIRPAWLRLVDAAPAHRLPGSLMGGPHGCGAMAASIPPAKLGTCWSNAARRRENALRYRGFGTKPVSQDGRQANPPISA